jgi:hypothetical protein
MTPMAPRWRRAVAPAAGAAPIPAYVKQIETWRRERLQRLTATAAG